MANETVVGVNDSGNIDNYGYTRGNCYVGGERFPGLSSGAISGALRFSGITVPQGTSINFSRIYLKYGYTNGTGTWKWRLYGIDEDNTGDFSSSPFGRTKTSSYNQYNEGEPTSGGFKVLNSDGIVNEIFGRGGWSTGNSLGFLLTDDGSDSEVYARFDLTESYFVYRISAEPDFTPTPTTVSAPSIPATADYGLKISYPGVDVLSATEAQTYYTSRKKRFKVSSQAQVVTTSSPYSVAHGLSYIPFAEVFAKVGTEWYRLPHLNYSLGENVGYYTIDDGYLNVYAGTSRTIYYYIFLDELAT